MNADLYLRQLEINELRIENKIAEIQQLESLAMDISPHLTDIKVKSSSDPQRAQEVLAKLIDAKDELSKEVDNLIDLETEIKRNLEKLPPLEYDVLYRLYIRHQTLQEVADQKNYTRQAVYKIKNKGLENLQKIINS